MGYIPKQKRKSYQPKKIQRFGQDPFYNKVSWRRTSKALRSITPICPVCDERPSNLVDHVISRSLDGADYDHDNLLPMCHPCHNIKRGLEARANGPLLDTKYSATEDKLIPVDKMQIIPLLIRGVKSFEDKPDMCSHHKPVIGEWKVMHMVESNDKKGIKRVKCEDCGYFLFPEEI